MILGRFTKQPAENLDYDTDLAEFLDGDTLVELGGAPSPLSVVVSPTGLTIGPTFVVGGTAVKQWLSGGTDGVTYKITSTVTTNAGRVIQYEFVVKVKDV